MSTIKSSDEHLTLNADGTSKDIKLQSNASEKVIIKSDGNVGLGTSSPDSSLEIYKASTAELMIGSDNGGTAQISLYENNSTTKEATIKYDGFANNLVIGTSGEANAIVIPRDSGNVGIGVTPEAWHNDYRNLAVGGTGVLWSQKAVGTGKAMGVGQNVYYDGSNKYITTDEASRYYQANGVHTFEVAPSGSADAAISWTTAMTIDNIACTMVGNNQENNSAAGYSSSTPHLSCSGNGYASLTVRRTADTGACVNFFGSSSASSTVGNITVSGSSTSYNTSSDYRLKENVVDMENATDRIKQLKPKRFNFKADDSVTVDGFLAHEVSDIVPEAISGTKDKVDDNGNAVHQAIDQSKLVPLLVKTIQELEARITELENA